MAGASPRHARQTILPEVGVAGQTRLREASVLVIGAGGLGCPILLHLVAAGVGRLGLVDPDRVDVSNLQRQVLYTTEDVGRLKTDAATLRLRALDPSVRLESWPIPFTTDHAAEILPGFNLVLDGTDNFASRYVIHDACRQQGVPLVQGSVLRFAGQLTTFSPDGPCYRCLFPEPPAAAPSCADAGVLGVLPGVMGGLMATEALKWLLGVGHSLIGRFLRYDALAMTFHETTYARDPECPGCSPTALTQPAAQRPSPICGPPPETLMKTLEVESLRDWLSRPGAPVVLDVREPHEWALCRIPGALHIPLGELAGRAAELPPDRPVVVNCHHGMRSARAATFLLASGRTEVYNLTGGIHAWAERIDPSMPRY
jgi:adenylyltransferase/sulfurtransferase